MRASSPIIAHCSALLQIIVWLCCCLKHNPHPHIRRIFYRYKYQYFDWSTESECFWHLCGLVMVPLPISSLHDASAQHKLELGYLWRSWRQSAGARPRRAETDCGCGAPASAGLWTSRAGRRRRGWTEPAGAAGKGLRQWADGEAGSSLPSAAPWFYWSRLGYPADSQKTTFVTREQPSVQSASLEEAMVPAVGWPQPLGGGATIDFWNQQHPLSDCVSV